MVWVIFQAWSVLLAIKEGYFITGNKPLNSHISTKDTLVLYRLVEMLVLLESVQTPGRAPLGGTYLHGEHKVKRLCSAQSVPCLTQSEPRSCQAQFVNQACCLAQLDFQVGLGATRLDFWQLCWAYTMLGRDRLWVAWPSCYH